MKQKHWFKTKDWMIPGAATTAIVALIIYAIFMPGIGPMSVTLGVVSVAIIFLGLISWFFADVKINNDWLCWLAWTSMAFISIEIFNVATSILTYGQWMQFVPLDFIIRAAIIGFVNMLYLLIHPPKFLKS